MATKQDNMRPIMPRQGASSVTPEQAHERRRQRRAIKHGKGQKKRQKGK